MTEETLPKQAAATTRLVDARGRGTRIEFCGDDEFHACWYPLALSSEVGSGTLIGAPFLDGRVIVYRTSDGLAHVRSAYCRHLGADLSMGRLLNDQVQCPFHFWRYDSAGSCIDVPAGDPPPPHAKLFSYPTAESLGIIWAFNGDTPLHPAPHFGQGDEALLIDTYRNPRQMQVESSIVFLNSFDLQHFRVVHGMPIDVDLERVSEHEHTLAYKARVSAPEFGDVIQDRRLWGVNTVTIASETAGRRLYQLHSLCPVGRNATQGFLVSATPMPADATDDGATRLLAQSRDYALRLVNEDAPIFDTLSFRRDNLTASDRFLAFGIQYIRRYPRAHPGRELIR
ncbi:Rieske 2Fe-2S domain-containing protein [Paraburkholderia sp. JPY432]|uniref:Rieske 2Fe-2S domain-containing protein n=1 Tax=Paraburkholderia youngii TaxID=2782701 RepID=UPI00159510E7|nr:Rieske 2Fe-2S domain-containing protein [Paraburkholderia youngii]NVH76107.1 Rieske 2Fe-2S domain-containing protein [Paraburkholderia youngii]